ncbi:UDP-N-acetylglucosamine transferase subunit ALG13 homolog [Aethina tumida]|uniref:UDP-N-acetylglucosamine transferase subunit ALG13 homolog n=1 Tax=Aethina tumida TaxID=116153 RepID=UPI00096B5474|nr:UDP-N-acetylglucosamine transferase subunit ALG13 homolog [Aethina tumida]
MEEDLEIINTGFERVFVTVGTTKFPKLIDVVTSSDIHEAFLELGVTCVLLQYGKDYPIHSLCDKGFKLLEKQEDSVTYCSPDNEIVFHCIEYTNKFIGNIRESDLVIGHAGAGTCLEVLRETVPLIIVINEDLMDNHQQELAEKLQEEGYAYYCKTEQLKNALLNYKTRKPYPIADPYTFPDYLDKCMGYTD